MDVCGYSWHHKGNRSKNQGLSSMHGMAEDLSCEESDYGSSDADSVGNSKSKSEVSLSCKFSSFEGDSSGSEAADGATVEPYQYESLGSHLSGGTDSSGENSPNQICINYHIFPKISPSPFECVSSVCRCIYADM